MLQSQHAVESLGERDVVVKTVEVNRIATKKFWE